jgi:hypothetical protein
LKCEICSREAQAQPASKYCEPHQGAYENVLNKFDAWKKASNTQWNQYLAEVARNPQTGTWAKEVAEHILSKKE